MKKVFAFVLAVLECLFLLVSCGQTEPADGTDAAVTDGTQPTQTTETAASAETEPPIPPPDLPDVTFDGEDFRLYAWNIDGWHTFEDLSVEDPDANVLADSVYRRNKAIEEKYGVTMDVVFDFYETHYNNVINNTRAGDDYADLVLCFGLSAGSLMMSGPFRNLLTMDHLTFDAPWFDQNSVSGLTLNGYLPYAATAATLNDKGALFCTFFNLDLARDLGITDNIYQVVLDGKWTQDKMLELGTQAVGDLNFNGTPDGDADRYGVAGNCSAITAIFGGSGNRYVSIDEDGEPYASFYTERTVDSMTNFLEKIMFRKELYYNAHIQSYNVIKLFMEDRALSYVHILSYGDNLREMKSNYAVIPVPKYDEAQEQYYAPLDIFTTYLTAIPMTLDEAGADRAAVLWEALSYESYVTVLPVFYDVVLDYKIVRDKQSTEMLDILFDSVVYDVGHIYNIAALPDSLMGLDGHNPAFGPESTDIASFYAKYQQRFEKEIEEYAQACGRMAAEN